ncbi:MAG: mannosyltransferase [Solirubrobacterales bacterium]|nr:mannosyltransferase [Solirubrobacterales bacterium]
MIVAGALIRFLTLGAQSFDRDEAVTAARILQPSLGNTLAIIPDSERTPPLYYVLAWGWSHLFGHGAIGLRSLSALFGTLTIPAAYLAARRLASGRAGLVAAGLVAFNPFLIWYSQEARAYALLILLTGVGLYLFVRALETPTPSAYAAWAVGSALALATHYFAAFLVAPEAIWLVVAARHRLAPALATLGVSAVGVALLPLAIHQHDRYPNVVEAARTPLLRRGLHLAVSFAFVNGQRVEASGIGPTEGMAKAIEYGSFTVLAAAAVLAAVLLASRSPARKRRGAIVAFVIGGAAIIVPMGLAVAGLDLFDLRNESATLLPLLVALAVGLSVTPPPRVGIGAAVLTCVVFATAVVTVELSPALQRDDWRGFAAALGPPHGERLIILLGNPPAEPFLSYLDGSRPVFPPAVRRPPYASHLSGAVVAPHVQVSEIEVVGATGGAHRSPAPGFGLRSRSTFEGKSIERFGSKVPRRVDLATVEHRTRFSGSDHLLLAGD